MSAGDDAETRLIQEAQSGSRSALEELLLNHYARLEARIAKKIPADLRSRVSAEDVLQEAFSAAVRGIRGFEPDGPDAFYRWLATLAEHRLIDLIRESRAEKRGGGRVGLQADPAESRDVIDLLSVLAVHVRTPSRSAAHHEMVAAIQTALERVEERYREVLRLRYVEGLSVTQTAERLGKTEPAVMMLCHRGLRRLRDELGTSSGFFSRKE